MFHIIALPAEEADYWTRIRSYFESFFGSVEGAISPFFQDCDREAYIDSALFWLDAIGNSESLFAPYADFIYACIPAITRRADNSEKKIEKSLNGLRAVSYYGCLLVRPPKITDAAHWEDPKTLDLLLSRLGAESISWPYKTECCGGSLVLTDTGIAHKLIGRIVDMAIEAEADCIVTACPLCQSNIDTREEEIASRHGKHYNLPVFYFTELMAIAFGVPNAEACLKKHFVDAMPLLESKNLLNNIE